MSPRVLVRAPEPGDRDAFVAAMRASRALHGPWITAPDSEAAFEAWLARVTADARREAYLICRRSDGAIAGYANVSEIVRGPLQSAFLGYGAAAELAGQGYMTEGIGLVLREAFLELRLHRLEANVQPGNARSIALLERCGFRREGFSPRYLKLGGRWRDHERWAILAEEWRAGRRS